MLREGQDEKQEVPLLQNFVYTRPKDERQKTCGDPLCQKAHKAKNNLCWRRNNPGYFSNDYPRLQQWLDHHPGYLKEYRDAHPDYMKKNREATSG